MDAFPAARTVPLRRILSHQAPAASLAVFLLLGCLTARLAGDVDPYWLSGAAVPLWTLALVHPSPLAVSAAGYTAGILLERLKTRRRDAGPGAGHRQFTVLGRVTRSAPSLHGRQTVTLQAREMLGTRRRKVNFLLRTEVEEGRAPDRGARILMRAAVLKWDPGDFRSIPRVRSAEGGWVSAVPGTGCVTAARRRVAAALASEGPGSAAGLLGALSLGERWRLTAPVREVMRRTGTTHLMAISGVHVAAAVLPFILILRAGSLLSDRTRPRTLRCCLLLVTLPTLATYITFTGASSSALRAVAYLALAGAAVVLGRGPARSSALAWCVISVVFFGPGARPDLALFLSALAVTGILTVSGDVRPPGETRSGEKLVRMTLGAVLFTTPVTVWLAGGVSVVAPAVNAAAALPFGAVLIPWAVFINWTALIPGLPLETLVNAWLRVGEATLGLMAWVAQLPFSFFPLCFTGRLTAAVGSVAGIVLWRRKGYRSSWGLALYLAVIAVSVLGSSLQHWLERDQLIITFPAVGQADAAVLRAGGRTVLVDAGPAGRPGCENSLAKCLKALGVGRIDAVFLSHPHPDHTGGLEDISARWALGTVYVPGWGERGDWARLAARLHGDGAVSALNPGDRIGVGPMEIRVAGPGEASRNDTDPNKASLRILVEAMGYRALFTGDCSWDQFSRAMSGEGRLHLLKIPHHGSGSGFPVPELAPALTRLRRAGPFILVCPSPPPGNRPLPARKVVNWFARHGHRLLFTGEKGLQVRYTERSQSGSVSDLVDKVDAF